MAWIKQQRPLRQRPERASLGDSEPLGVIRMRTRPQPLGADHRANSLVRVVTKSFKDDEWDGLVLGYPEAHVRKARHYVVPRLFGSVVVRGSSVLVGVLAGAQTHKLVGGLDHVGMVARPACSAAQATGVGHTHPVAAGAGSNGRPAESAMGGAFILATATLCLVAWAVRWLGG
jgi:hypothetical protein